MVAFRLQYYNVNHAEGDNVQSANRLLKAILNEECSLFLCLCEFVCYFQTQTIIHPRLPTDVIKATHSQSITCLHQCERSWRASFTVDNTAPCC